jgi:hypothetical protein
MLEPYIPGPASLKHPGYSVLASLLLPPPAKSKSPSLANQQVVLSTPVDEDEADASAADDDTDDEESSIGSGSGSYQSLEGEGEGGGGLISISLFWYSICRCFFRTPWSVVVNSLCSLLCPGC